MYSDYRAFEFEKVFLVLFWCSSRCRGFFCGLYFKIKKVDVMGVEKKEFIKELLKKYNKQKIKVVEKINPVDAGAMSNGDIKIVFDIERDFLIIEDVITKDNIHLYYEFMSDDDLEENGELVESTLLKRKEQIIKKLNISNLDFVSNVSNLCASEPFFILNSILFGIKDTLKPINEYIIEIKGSSEYKKYVYSSIDDYQNRLTDEQKDIVLEHCKENSIKPIICAWYDDMDDFYSDWCDEVGYSKEYADALYSHGSDSGEFLSFSDKAIVRFSL